MNKTKRNTYVIAIVGHKQEFVVDAYTPKEAIISLMAKCKCKIKSIIPTF